MAEANGFEKGSSLEALRAQIITWTQGHEELSAERDKRYDERNKHYEDKFEGQDKAVASALSAQEKLTTAAFDAAQQANDKAATGIEKHFEVTNRFQQRLDEQARDMATKGYVDSKIETALEKLEIANKEIRLLREAGSEGSGRHDQRLESRQQSQWGMGTTIGLVFGALGSVIGLAGVIAAFVSLAQK